MSKNKNKNYTIRTFSKIWVNRLMWVALFDIQLSYVLAFFDKEIAETLSIAIVTEILGVMLGYFCKSYFETKEEKKNELDTFKFEKYMEVESDDANEEDARG